MIDKYVKKKKKCTKFKMDKPNTYSLFQVVIHVSLNITTLSETSTNR